MCESYPAGSQSIDVWRLVVFGTVASKRLPTDVICHDQNYIWLLGGRACDWLRCIAARVGDCENEKGREKVSVHIKVDGVAYLEW